MTTIELRPINHKYLAEFILRWHGGGGSALYQVGSSWYAGHYIKQHIIEQAASELEDAATGEFKAGRHKESREAHLINLKLLGVLDSIEVCVELPKGQIVSGYTDTPSRSTVFTPEGHARHPGANRWIKWGSYSANSWATAQSGNSWGIARSNFIKRLDKRLSSHITTRVIEYRNKYAAELASNMAVRVDVARNGEV